MQFSVEKVVEGGTLFNTEGNVVYEQGTNLQFFSPKTSTSTSSSTVEFLYEAIQECIYYFFPRHLILIEEGNSSGSFQIFFRMTNFTRRRFNI